MSAKDLGKKLLERAGLVVRRAPGNRFEAMEASLQQLRVGGFRPRVVIDCGANQGQWFGLASSVFPESAFHLVEPQQECWAALDEAAARRGRTNVHRVAATAPGTQSVRMARSGGEVSTGAFVMSDTDSFPSDLTAAATTLDDLLAARVHVEDRALLKLDIEGHELEALRGATSLLARVEVILCEVRFYDVYHAGAPAFGAVMAFLGERGFSLFDFASLSGRKKPDHRLWLGDAIFIRNGSPLGEDVSLE
jgi:FkbM family methyltransferase